MAGPFHELKTQDSETILGGFLKEDRKSWDPFLKAK